MHASLAPLLPGQALLCFANAASDRRPACSAAGEGGESATFDSKLGPVQSLPGADPCWSSLRGFRSPGLADALGCTSNVTLRVHYTAYYKDIPDMPFPPKTTRPHENSQPNRPTHPSKSHLHAHTHTHTHTHVPRMTRIIRISRICFSILFGSRFRSSQGIHDIYIYIF